MEITKKQRLVNQWLQEVRALILKYRADLDIETKAHSRDVVTLVDKKILSGR